MSAEELAIEPLAQPFDRRVSIPGSKSITNRALVCAALARGTSTLTGLLDADDTQAMLGAVAALGADVQPGAAETEATITGTAGEPLAGTVDIDVHMSGTTARFVPPMAARGRGTYRIDGAPEMRARPMGATAEALRALGVTVQGDSLPLTVSGGAGGGELTLRADVSSQFASGMLLAAPGLPAGLTVRLAGPVVSRPYLDMTVAVMEAFGATVERRDENTFLVPPDDGYIGTDYAIEPDASAASYFLAAAAVTGSRVRIDGLGTNSLQGDVGFAQVLAEMGADVTIAADHVEVAGLGRLVGVDVDMAHISDTAQTLAAIAPFAQGPTRVTGIGFIRNKETDRVGAVVTELKRLGIDATEHDDGFVIRPGRPTAATVRTYSDHRMAMSFAITGLAAPGVTIADPGCVAKTFPTFWQVLETLR